MAITREDVVHVAKLARLELSESEIERMVRDLGTILEHVAELSKVDTSNVEPTAYVAVDAAPLRPDEVIPGVPRELALREAPRHEDGGFAVPGFVDEG
ncbi:MAG TPA: Asp-tRNA(Asn)/Glu-tRNA(Gln) amidotransferase subunit GatC [Polyangiaceae bacterium]|jgi:aspartyl-tRNA(Asn)/glutamyl-tRNA(Gln) amidotransferase subunit C|nr:Asp-tRNA(Asn)/Glu-tRNA(Gln) amidotransferase subunit GatC [Polyangiaceae bacterium]